ncbi:hypothetical protein N9937_01745 [bacterium]|nr:hypothetical protein [bacterium]
MTATLTSETLESRIERLTVAYLKDNCSPAPASGFRQMDEDSEPVGDYCSVSAIVEDQEVFGAGTGWKELAITIEYRRGDHVEEDGDDIDAKAFDARWSAITCALDGMTRTDLVEDGSCNTVSGTPYTVDREDRENEEDERVRRRVIRSISGLIDPEA